MNKIIQFFKKLLTSNFKIGKYSENVVTDLNGNIVSQNVVYYIYRRRFFFFKEKLYVENLIGWEVDDRIEFRWNHPYYYTSSTNYDKINKIFSFMKDHPDKVVTIYQ